MDNNESIDEDILTITNNELVNIIWFGIKYDINSKILNFSMDFILMLKMFSIKLIWLLHKDSSADL